MKNIICIFKNKLYTTLTGIFIAIVGLLPCTGQVNIAQPIRHISTGTNGLADRRVLTIFQDHYGILWIGTENGLSRFDGVDVHNYTDQEESNIRLSGHRISNIAEDFQHNLWVATENGIVIINSLRNDTIPITTILKKANNLATAIKSITNGPPGELLCWVGHDIYSYSLNGFNLKFHGNAKTSLHAPTLLFKYNSIDSSVYFMDQNRILNKLTTTGLHDLSFPIIEKKTGTISVLTDYSYAAIFTNDRQGPILTTGGDTGLVFDLAYENGKPIYLKSGYNELQKRFEQWSWISDFIIEKKGGLEKSILGDLRLSCTEFIGYDTWAVGTNYGVFLVKKHSIPFKHLKFTGGSSIRGIFQDAQNHLFAGSYDGMHYIELPDIHYSLIQDANLIWDFAPLSEDSFLVCVEHFDGLHLLVRKGSKFTRTPLKNSRFFGFSKSIASVPHGYWSGTFSNTLYFIDKNFNIKPSAFNDSMPRNLVKAILFSEKTGLWVATDSGLQLFGIDPSTGAIISNLTSSLPPLLTKANLNTLLVASDGSLWAGSTAQGLFYYSKKTGILRHWTEIDGLPNNTIYSILFGESESLLWIGTQNGLSNFNTQNNNFVNFFREDGLEQNEFNTAARHKSSDGTLYFGGLNGVIFFHPEDVTTTQKPAIVSIRMTFHNILTGNEREIYPENGQTIQIYPEEKYADCYFRSNALFQGNNLKFRYQIKELNPNWKVSPVLEKITFAGLPPGHYTIIAQVLSPNGQWGTEFQVVLIILPAWYESWWFFTLILFCLVGGVYVLYRLRIRKLQQEFNLRQQISHDLHDDLGSRISLLRSLSYQIINPLSSEDIKEAYLGQFETISKDTFKTIRDFIWAFDPNQDNVYSLFDRMDDFAENYLSTLVELSIERPKLQEDFKIGPRTKHHLINIYQELLNNMIKHTVCKKAIIRLSVIGKTILIEIQNHHEGLRTHEKDITLPNISIGRQSLENRLREIGAEILWEEELFFQKTVIKVLTNHKTT